MKRYFTLSNESRFFKRRAHFSKIASGAAWRVTLYGDGEIKRHYRGSLSDMLAITRQYFGRNSD